MTAEKMLIDKAQLLTLTAPEMTVLIGGLRVLGANYNSDKNGVFTENQETLSNDFFVNLLDMNNEWHPSTEAINEYIDKARHTGVIKWHASRVDLIFGSNAQLRAIAELYASNDSKMKFINDFIAAWIKVMELDRCDIK